jgi:hypothetical protein
MDVNSASPDVVEPLPFHGMGKYPSSASTHARNTPAMQRYRAQYNTRRLHKILPPLDLRN